MIFSSSRMLADLAEMDQVEVLERHIWKTSVPSGLLVRMNAAALTNKMLGGFALGGGEGTGLTGGVGVTGFGGARDSGRMCGSSSGYSMGDIGF